MAKTAKPLTYDELVAQVSGFSLQDKLSLLEELKEDIDSEQADLSSKLDAINKTKSKINGEGK